MERVRPFIEEQLTSLANVVSSANVSCSETKCPLPTLLTNSSPLGQNSSFVALRGVGAASETTEARKVNSGREHVLRRGTSAAINFSRHVPAPNSAGCTTPPASECRMATPRSRQTDASVCKQQSAKARPAAQAAAIKQRGALDDKSESNTALSLKQWRWRRREHCHLHAERPPTRMAIKKRGKLSCTAPQMSQNTAPSPPLI